jgi:hypothetical protein
VVYTRGNGYLRIYVDGVVVGLIPWKTYSQPSNLRLGYQPSLSGQPAVGFAGRLSHVALYNRELTAAEVLTHRFAGIVGMPDIGGGGGGDTGFSGGGATDDIVLTSDVSGAYSGPAGVRVEWPARGITVTVPESIAAEMVRLGLATDAS